METRVRICSLPCVIKNTTICYFTCINKLRKYWKRKFGDLNYGRDLQHLLSSIKSISIFHTSLSPLKLLIIQLFIFLRSRTDVHYIVKTSSLFYNPTDIIDRSNYTAHTSPSPIEVFMILWLGSR